MAKYIPYGPTTDVHVSLYSKLKYPYKTAQMMTPLRDILKRYSKIQSHRNDLFHGRRVQMASVETVRLAIESFDWIQDNFKAK